MSELDGILAGAVGREDVPFVVATVVNADGVLWEGTAGEARPGQPARLDTMFRLFSQTKAVGSLAAMILVDRGLLSPDTIVESVLPEFSAIRVLDSLDDNGPNFRAPRRPVTLRDLLTHTSGFAYDTWNAHQRAYQEFTGMPHIIVGTLASMYYPLQFDPGDGWAYGIGLDWVGQMIERVDGRRVDQFCYEEILEPLGMSDTVFEIDSRSDRLASLLARSDDGSVSQLEFAAGGSPEFYGLGSALYGTAPDYAKFMRLVLNKGEVGGRRLVSSEALNLLLTNQIGDMSIPVMRSQDKVLAADVDLLPGTRMTHTLGFLRNETDVPGRRSAGSLTWGGGANTMFWIDPSRDLAAVFMTQIFPFCNPRFMAAYEDFERGVYRVFG